MKNISLLFIYLFSIVAFGQDIVSNDFVFTTGTPEKSVYPGITGYRLTEYLYAGTKNIISVKTSGTQITVQRHDATSLKEISKQLYTDLPENSKIQKIVTLQNKLVVFYSTITKTDISIVSYREVDNNEGTLLPPVKCFEGSGRIASFQFFQSQDKSKILIQYRNIPVNRSNASNYDVLGFYVINSDLTHFSGAEVQMPLTEKMLVNMNYTVCNSGAVYFLSKNIQDKKFELRTITDKTTTIIPLNNLDSTFSSIAFSRLLMSENAKGNLIFTGYYMNGVDKRVEMFGAGFSVFTEENDNGIFHFEFSKSGQFIKKTIYEFSLNLINQNEAKSAQNKNTQNEKKDYAGIKNLFPVSVIENTDGSVIITGTQMTFADMAFTFGHIIVCKLDEAGKVLWINKIPRSTIGYFLYSFNYYRYQNTDYIFFADNPLNADIDNTTAPKNFYSEKGGNFVAYKIDDATGKFSKNSVLNIEDMNGIVGSYFFRNNFFETSAKTLAIEIFTNSSKEVFVKMRIK